MNKDKVTERWEFQRISTDDVPRLLEAYETGWEPFNVLSEARFREIWFRRQVVVPVDEPGSPLFMEGGGFRGVTAAP